MTITADVGGLNSLLDRLAVDVQDAARPAAYAGGEVLYKVAASKVAGIGRVTGNLASALYIAYSRD